VSDRKIGFSETDSLPNCCGVGDVGGFEFYEGSLSNYWNAHEDVACSGTGMFTAAFIDEEESKAAYEFLCKKHTLLFQSDVRVNSGSGNKLFLCVFLHKDKRPKKKPIAKMEQGELDAYWPLERAGKDRLPK
jgi:hypothetical protein